MVEMQDRENVGTMLVLLRAPVYAGMFKLMFLFNGGSSRLFLEGMTWRRDLSQGTPKLKALWI